MYEACEAYRKEGKRIGFVPTMGALHDGHLALVDSARTEGEVVAVSIFVNPKQFGPNEDLDKYPRTLEADREKLAGKADLVFAPSPRQMYPDGHVTEVKVPTGVTEGLCGERRPGHFDGMALVVTKLFNIVGPSVAVFGRKDYQQLQVIKRFTADLNLPVEIAEVPTIRETDGLAMSSRNRYLADDDRQRALAIVAGLRDAHRRFPGPPLNVGEILTPVKNRITAVADRVDYITAAHPDTLVPYDDNAPVPEKLFIAVAAFFGATRLIDNTVLGEDTLPV